MFNYKKFKGIKPKLSSPNSRYDENIYTFDIETSSYFVIDNKIHPPLDYLMFSEKERKNSARCSMYVWQFGVNEVVYYGRTWSDLKKFIDVLERENPYIKTIWVHNLAFEFQFLKSVFSFKEVFARARRKPISALMSDYNIEFRCSYYLSNVALEKLSSIYELPVEKMSGDLDYDLIRHSKTRLTEKEKKYCENDCLVLYEYIKKELSIYETIKNIPKTNTGKVRRELKKRVITNKNYLKKVRSIISDNPKVYDFLIRCFAGGYVHANYIYTSHVIENVDSWDFTSSYPYILATHKFPMTEFKKCNIKKISDMISKFAYLIHIKFKKIKSKYFNNIISYSKCLHVSNVKLDNGRIISADSLETYITDIDLNLICLAYNFEEYEIIESYYSKYDYLPKEIIEFVLEKYVMKTKYKGVEEKKLEYQLAKGQFNAIYGMCVTSVINDDVLYDDILDWCVKELNNDDIINKLKIEKKKGFLAYQWGVFTTAWARNNLIRCLLKLDEYVIYSDTDSLKLAQGYNKEIIDIYNKFVENKINKVSKDLNIDIEKFAPTDIKGKKRMLGIFDYENDSDYEFSYKSYITQGSKKYAYISSDLDKKTNKYNDNIHIVVAGVPKRGAKCLKSLSDFNDNLVFDYKTTGKKLICYVDEQEPVEITDYRGKKLKIYDKTGVCILPNEYTMSKSEDYIRLITDNHEKKAIYKFKEDL